MLNDDKGETDADCDAFASVKLLKPIEGPVVLCRFYAYFLPIAQKHHQNQNQNVRSYSRYRPPEWQYIAYSTFNLPRWTFCVHLCLKVKKPEQWPQDNNTLK